MYAVAASCLVSSLTGSREYLQGEGYHRSKHGIQLAQT